MEAGLEFRQHSGLSGRFNGCVLSASYFPNHDAIHPKADRFPLSDPALAHLHLPVVLPTTYYMLPVVPMQTSSFVFTTTTTTTTPN